MVGVREGGSGARDEWKGRFGRIVRLPMVERLSSKRLTSRFDLPFYIHNGFDMRTRRLIVQSFKENHSDWYFLS